MCSVEEVKRVLCAEPAGSVAKLAGADRDKFKADRLELIKEIDRAIKDRIADEEEWVPPAERDTFFDYEKEFS